MKDVVAFEDGDARQDWLFSLNSIQKRSKLREIQSHMHQASTSNSVNQVITKAKTTDT